jgi:hypothetical protein
LQAENAVDLTIQQGRQRTYLLLNESLETKLEGEEFGSVL